MHFCRRCSKETVHNHLHDEAHGIFGTHMAGSERFVCKECGNVVFKGDEPDGKFVFILD